LKLNNYVGDIELNDNQALYRITINYYQIPKNQTNETNLIFNVTKNLSSNTNETIYVLTLGYPSQNTSLNDVIVAVFSPSSCDIISFEALD
jgi:hypothetical protein